MSENQPLEKQVDDFIRHEIDTVPHLEALLLLLKFCDRDWTVDQMAAALYIPPARARNILQGLARRRFIAPAGQQPESYRYHPASEPLDAIIRAVDRAYRSNLIHISRMIHSKATPSVREFADAFRFKKERD